MNNVRKVIIDGCQVPWDIAVSQMDDTLREQLQAKTFATDQEFADAYADAHRRKYGEPFSIE
jgi:hypothetical protein